MAPAVRPRSRNGPSGAPGRAGPDAYVTAHHLRDMLALATVQQLLAWSAEPALLVRVPNGALRGRRWQELNDAQLGQVLDGAFGWNQDMVFTARAEQARRGKVRSVPVRQMGLPF